MEENRLSLRNYMVCMAITSDDNGLRQDIADTIHEVLRVEEHKPTDEKFEIKDLYGNLSKDEEIKALVRMAGYRSNIDIIIKNYFTKGCGFELDESLDDFLSFTKKNKTFIAKRGSLLDDGKFYVETETIEI